MKEDFFPQHFLCVIVINNSLTASPINTGKNNYPLRLEINLCKKLMIFLSDEFGHELILSIILVDGVTNTRSNDNLVAVGVLGGVQGRGI